MQTELPPRLYTIADVAGLFRVSRNTVNNWIANGTLPKPRKFGQLVRWPAGDIDRLVEASK